jgi:hypothetical protein
MKALAEDPELAAKIGRAASETVSRSFTLEKMVAASEKVLVQVLRASDRGQA